MLTTLYLTKISMNKIWSGKPKKIKNKTVQKMSDSDWEKYSQIANEIKK